MQRNFFITWFLAHMRAFRFALQSFAKAPVIHIFTAVVIGVAMALPLGLFVLLQNVQGINATLHANKPTISLYLQSSASTDDVNNFLQTLRQDSRIAKVTYISPEEGLKTFQKNTVFDSALSLFQNNPLPGVVVVYPSSADLNPVAMNALYISLKSLPLVDVAQLDMKWITRVNELIHFCNQLTRALFILFAGSVLLIIGHSLRGSLLHHAPDIQVLKLLGATNSYIRRPLLYRGMLYGLLGGLAAWLLVDLFLLSIASSLLHFTESYDFQFQLRLVSAFDTVTLLIFTVLLGTASAWFITNHFLARPESVV